MAESSPVLRGPWPLGINNKTHEKAVPKGALRDSVNYDPSADGVLRLRSGYQKVMPGVAVRGALAVGSHILIADGSNLIDFNSETGSSSILKQIAGSGRFAGAVLNDELFFCTENECLRYRSGALREWGVPTVTAQPVPTVGQGSLAAGTYQCAATFTDARGDEGGTTESIIITVPASSSLIFPPLAPPAGGKAQIYVSSLNGSSLFLQGDASNGLVCSSVNDAAARLDTQFLRNPVPGDRICAHNGVLLIADGSVLHMTMPFRPHLRSAIKGWFQFPAPVDLVASGDGGLFVSADKTYFLTDIETPTPGSRKVFDFGAVRGSEAKGLRNEVMWMTRYGIAKSDGSGGASLVSESNFVPELSESATSALLESNGSQMIVTTLKAQKGINPLAASDTYDMEIIYP
ncbi:hypothetical protein LCG56_26935 [Pseudomonas cannabina pv. alisalensis]|uniref:Uncharacterized protein n=1 Tax=Pseudomonas syringae pv. maculicola str. ES4326 TaxID=629265 RepID=A0A8T8C0T3_PSEYM|nr:MULTISPECIES: hypothetical protein [Pseudomonas syringae group]QHE96863.1 hypothetical protein PMA4326_009655 [Pseudomonas syringae pv. maculicola str. ES4326]UBY97522.1 hypothetical protein LCG56_26935 [Pseudomonas cannabina pv. alisalensis]